ncbi:MAG: NTE family protein [Yoonia sp.]|jgi:NTE family protein
MAAGPHCEKNQTRAARWRRARVVLLRILQEEDVEIAAISGTSAGALNAVALKSGWVENGRMGAIENLNWLWGQVGAISDPVFMPWIAAAEPSVDVWANAMKYSLAYTAFEMTSQMFSPYVYGSAMQNPLSDIVKRFHYDAVCADAGPALHICAKNVRSGKIRVFTGEEIMPEVIMPLLACQFGSKPSSSRTRKLGRLKRFGTEDIQVI